MISIRTKLFLNISFLLAVFVLVSWCLSIFFLEDYHIWNKKQNLLESSEAIASLYTAGSRDLSLEIERIATNIGAHIVITNQEGYIKHSSFDRLTNKQNDDRPPRIPGIAATDDAPPRLIPPPPPTQTMMKVREEIGGDSAIEVLQDNVLNINFIVLTRRMANNDLLIIRLPLASVSESASYANKFMAFTGLLATLIGCTWAFFFARKFTVPLKELSDVAASISQLDFSRRSTYSSDDEVGRLGKSIDNLSRQLSKSITELNQKNRQLMADVERERQLDKLRRNFISSVSHELKTPISLILGYAEGLTDNVARDKATRDYYCSVIADEAGKMDKLVNDLLDLSQIESGYFRLTKTDFDISELIDDVTLKYRTMLEERHITLQTEKEAVTIVNGDRFRSEQVIINLLNNAIDHVQDPSRIKITVEKNPDKVRVTIFNTGKHIPPDSMDNLWLSFYKIDQARTRGLGGYGLGLSIVRAIQELHGNRYGVKNAAGGVLFWFELDPASSMDTYE